MQSLKHCSTKLTSCSKFPEWEKPKSSLFNRNHNVTNLCFFGFGDNFFYDLFFRLGSIFFFVSFRFLLAENPTTEVRV